MNAITVKMPIDQPIWTSVAGGINAPSPIGVVAAIAPSPPKKSSNVPNVSMASRIRLFSNFGFENEWNKDFTIYRKTGMKAQI